MINRPTYAAAPPVAATHRPTAPAAGTGIDTGAGANWLDPDVMAARADSVNAIEDSPGIWNSWMGCFENLRSEDQKRMVLDVNDQINAWIAYAPDSVIYGQAEYYAPPMSCVMNGAGDCEDFAILKAATLMSLGIEASRMSLVSVNDDKNACGSDHAVLKVNFGTAEKPDEWICDINRFESGGTFAPLSEAREKYRFYSERNLKEYKRIVPKPMLFYGT